MKLEQLAKFQIKNIEKITGGIPRLLNRNINQANQTVNRQAGN